MIIYCPKFNPKEITFQKLSPIKSGMAYDENKEFYIEGNDVSCAQEQQIELFTLATLTKEKVGGLTRGGKEKYYAAKKFVTLLLIIADFSPTLISIAQLRALYKMRTNQEISQKKLGEAVEKLLDYGFVEKCCIKVKSSDKPSHVMFKVSKRGAELLMKFCQKDFNLEKGRKFPSFNVDDLPPTWKAQENFQTCQIITEMFKNNFASSAFLDSKYDLELTNPKIINFVNIGKQKSTMKKLYVFSPRTQPGWEDYLTKALVEFSQRFENANEVPKLLLSCEDAEKLYLTRYLVETLNLNIDIVYTEDIAPINDFETAFSLFNDSGVEIQLSPIVQ